MVPTPDVSLADTRRTIVWIRMITIGILTAIALSIAGATVGQEQPQPAPNAIIFTRLIDHKLHIFVADPDGDSLVELDQVNNTSQQFGAHDGDLSPDGTTLVFSVYGLDLANEGPPIREIFIYNFVTETLTQLTNDGLDNYQPIWSPDGSRIAHFSRGIARNLSITDVATGVTNPLVYGRFLTNMLDQTGYVTGFDWSPSGEELVVSIQITGPGAFSSLYIVSASGDTINNILPAGMTGTMPAWNDTGSYIY
jgi:Tol biopolymer transport system component